MISTFSWLNKQTGLKGQHIFILLYFVYISSVVLFQFVLLPHYYVDIKIRVFI